MKLKLPDKWIPFWLLSASVGGLLGLVFFVLVYGAERLDPSAIGWLMSGDGATHFLGWHFFRNEPWGLPLGALHRYGMEIGSSVVYSDSIPLLALLIKPFSAWLPAVFQYTGFWIAATCTLQGWFGALLVRRITSSQILILLGAVFFVISPIAIFRSGGPYLYHFSLMGHWLILAALVLYFSPAISWRTGRWALLASAASLTHAYLAVMVLAIYGAESIKGLVIDRQSTLRGAFASGIVVGTALILTMWLGGFFTAGGIAGGNAEHYSMNLLAPVLPTPGYARFLKDFPMATSGQYEGYNYLGLGVLLLLVQGLGRLGCRPRPTLPSSVWPLILVCAMMGLYALSPRITLGSDTLVHLSALVPLSEIFRATGRMFWPAYYGILLAALALTIRGNKVGVAASILSLALMLQLADLAPHLDRRATSNDAEIAYRSRLSDPFWEQATAKYRRVLVIPPALAIDDFAPLAFYAACHDMAINIAYYGRPPSPEAERRRLERIQDFLIGQVDQEALYVFADPSWLALVEPLLDEHTGIGEVDGLLVVAPGAMSNGVLAPRAAEWRTPDRQVDLPSVRAGDTIHFASGDSQPYRLAGWSWAEPWGTWTDGDIALLGARLHGDIGEWLTVSLTAHAFSTPGRPLMNVEVAANGHRITTWRFEDGSPQQPLELRIPGDWVRNRHGELLLSLAIQHPASPAAEAISADQRRLGLGVERLKIDD